MNYSSVLEQIAGVTAVEKRAITNLSVRNEAYHYERPSSFSRGLRINLNGVGILLISGTASIDDRGESIHIGDFKAQLRRTYHNITQLLAAEGATRKDIVRTTCYLREVRKVPAVRTKSASLSALLPRPPPIPAASNSSGEPPSPAGS